MKFLMGALAWEILMGAVSVAFADPSALSGIDTSGIATPTSTSICNIPGNQGTAMYNKYCTGGGTSVAPPKVNPTQSMMNQMGQQMIFNGVQSLFHSDDKTPEQIQAEKQAEAARQQQKQQEEAAKRAQEEVEHQKLQSEMKLSGPTDSLGSDDGIKRADYSVNAEPGSPDPNDIKRQADEEEKKDMPKTRSDAFNKGYEHASNCYSQNSMSACGGVSAEEVNSCLADYRKGYQVGNKRKNLELAQANSAGKKAGAAGELANGAADPRADGPCQVQWIEAYNRGYFDGKASRPFK